MKLWITSFLAIVLFMSCSKSPKCWEENKNEGIIDSSLSVSFTCTVLSDQKEFVINDFFEYGQIFDNSFMGVGTCVTSFIDFANYSLLGLYTTGQCEVKYLREVIVNESDNRYEYTVYVKSCGNCKKEENSYNWVTVPKLPQGWTVSFEIESK